MVATSQPFLQPVEQLTRRGLVIPVRDWDRLRGQQADAYGVEPDFSGGLFDGVGQGRGHYGFAHSNRTMNCPVQWPESQRVH